MNYRRKTPLWPLWLAGLLLVCASSAWAVTLDIGDGAGTWGETVQVPVYLADVSGPIYSVEMELSFYQSYLEFTGVVTSGTLSAAWSHEFSAGPGSGQVALAGALPINSGGILCLLEFVPLGGNGGATIYLNGAVLNEDTTDIDLLNGLVTITMPPTINISPDSGVIPVGDSIAFNTTGGTGPYTYTSSNPAVAAFSASNNVLYGLSPGTVQVTATDSGGATDTTTGVIEVRPFILEAMDTGGTEGQPVLVPLIIFDPGGYDVRSAELDISWSTGAADFLGVVTAGSVMESAGWTTPQVNVIGNHIHVIAAGAGALPGSGVLCFLQFEVFSSFAVDVAPGLFNEDLQAYPVDGYVSVTPLPSITLSPTSSNLLVGYDLQLTLGGSPTFPVDYLWGGVTVIDITSEGLVTGLAAGWSDVWVYDFLGARTNTIHIEVYDFSLPSVTTTIAAGQTVLVPIEVERALDDLDIFSYELAFNYNPYYLEYLGVTEAGSATEDWGAPLGVDEGNKIKVYHAGPTKLTGCPDALVYLEFLGLPTIGGGAIPAGIIDSALFNEGSPRVLINYGNPCEASAAPLIPDARGVTVSNHPNPFNPGTTVSYAVGSEGGQARLAVYSAKGELIRELLIQPLAAGARGQVHWDGRDEQGRLQPSGVYFSRLEVGRQQARGKMILLK